MLRCVRCVHRAADVRRAVWVRLYRIVSYRGAISRDGAGSMPKGHGGAPSAGRIRRHVSGASDGSADFGAA
eukprot:361111-Prymnesium_polylepis.1